MFGSGCSFWPTPTAADAGYFPELEIHAGSIDIKGPTDVAWQSGGQYSLANAARIWSLMFRVLDALGCRPGMETSLYSLPVRVSFKHGEGSSPAGLISNPPFYELSMGWPIGWTAPEAQVTGFAAWLQRSRGALSEALTMQDGADQIAPGREV